MEGLHVPNNISINSHKGTYKVSFVSESFQKIMVNESEDSLLIIDELVLKTYKKQLSKAIKNFRHITIAANETNKSLERFPNYIKELTDLGVKRASLLLLLVEE